MKFFSRREGFPLKLILIAAFFCSLLISNNFAQTGSPLTFSEIMFYPSETNGEFIEIYNTSAIETIDLSGYKIKYYTSSPNTLTTFIGGTQLAPGKFAVILQGSYNYENGNYKSLIHADALILKIITNNFGSSGMSNSFNRELSLLNGSDEIIETYTYSADNAAGYSDEKVALNKNNDLSNWTNSTVINGTPGFKSSALILPGYSFGSLVINEIMFEPAEGNTEYLEFFNPSQDTIQLAGIQINVGSSNKYKMTDTFLSLPPKKYFILAADSAIYKNYFWLKEESISNVTGGSSLSLSNDGTTLLLKDSKGTTLDSLLYSPNWHSKNVVTTKNRSLERINALFDSNLNTNWNTCANVDGGTPGRQNSIFTQNLARESKVTISPNPFSPDGDGFEDFAVINFDLTHPLSQVRIKVFDNQGRIVRTLAENRLSSSNNSIVYDGLNDSGNPLRIGIYILLIETVGDGSGTVEFIKTPIVIARKL